MSDPVTDTVPASPGAILRRCREYHGISIKEAAEATKVGENYLEALEADRITEFASLAYLKGFLRIYANHLGLNPDDMMRLYDKLYGQNSTEADSGDVMLPTGTKRRIQWQRFVLPAILLAMIIITSYVMNRAPAPFATHQTTPTQQQVTAPPPPVQALRSSARQPQPLAGSEKPIEKPRESAATEPTHLQQSSQADIPAKSFIVRMKVLQNGSLNVAIDGSPSQTYELSVGDIIEWKAEKKIVLELSNGGGVEAELNGKSLRPLGPAGRPAVVTIDSDGIRP